MNKKRLHLTQNTEFCFVKIFRQIKGISALLECKQTFTKFFWQIFSWNQSCQQLKSAKPQHFHEFFHPKKSTIFSGNQSWIFGQKMKISNSVVDETSNFWGNFQILWINFQLMVSKSCCPQMSLTHLPSESVMLLLLLFWVYFRRCRRGHCLMIMRQNMRSMVIWRRGEISQTVTMLPTMVKPQCSTSLFIGRQGCRGGLRWPQMLVPSWWSWCGGWTVGFSQSIFSHGFQKIENSMPVKPVRRLIGPRFWNSASSRILGLMSTI